MKIKTFFINAGLSAAIYAVWLIVSLLLLLETDLAYQITIILSALILICGCVWLTYRTMSMFFFPVAVLITHIILEVVDYANKYAKVSALSNSDSTLERIIGYFYDGFLQLSIYFTIVSAVIIFLLTLITAFISKKYFKRRLIK